MVAETNPDGSSSPSTTRGRFPRNPLNDTLKLVEVVYREGHGDAVRRTSAFGELGRSPTSSASKTMLTSATRGYGLLSSVRRGTFLQPTELGLALVNAGGGEAERLSYAWGALTTNEIFQGFIDRYEHRPLPSDQVVADFLMDSFGLPAADAKTCFEVFIENLTEYGLIAHEGGTRVITPPEDLPSTVSNPSNVDDAETDQSESSAITNDDVVPEPATEISRSVLPTNGAAAVFGSEIQPQIAFNIQIQLPENASAETYEAIFKNISVHLLGRTEE